MNTLLVTMLISSWIHIHILSHTLLLLYISSILMLYAAEELLGRY